jgi:predicted RND superfamily exporter protein
MFDRLFRRRWLVLAVYAVAVPIGAWLSSRIKLDSNLLNLLPADIPAVKTVRKLESWSGGGALQFMYLGLVRDDRTSLPDLKRFAEAVGAELGRSRWVKGPISVGVDMTAIRKAAPLFLEPADLDTLGARLDTQVTALRKQRSGFFLDLEDEPPPLRVDDILPKVQRHFQWESGPGRDTPATMLARIRARTSPDGGRLYYLSPDDRMLTFFFNPVFPPDQLAHYPELVADVDAAIAAARAAVPGAAAVEIYRGGAYPLQWDQRDTTLRDAIRSTFWAGLIILCIDLLTVRRPRSTVMVYLSLATGLVVTFAIAYLAIGTVNVITAFLLAILAGLGVDFGYYFSTRYNLYANAGLGREAAVREAWTQTAVPAAMGALTTMAVMVILAFGRFRGFAELGIICSIGIVSIYVAMYTLCPALFLRFAKGGAGNVSVREAREIVGRAHADSDAARPGGARPGRFARFNPAGRAAPFVVAAAGIVTVALAVSARGVRFAYTGEELTVKNQKSLEIDRMILVHYGENVDQTITLADTEERARRIHDSFERRFGDFKSIARYESAFTYATPLAAQQAALGRMGPLRHALERLPRRDADPDLQFALAQAPSLVDPTPLTVDGLPEYLKAIYLGRDAGGRTLGYVGHIVAKHWLWDLDELERFVKEVESLEVDGQPVETTGRAQIFMRVIQIVQREATIFSIVGAVVILAMFWIQARRLRFALLCMLPLVVGIIWTLGCLPHIGEKGLYLSFMNLIVLPILVGLGVAFGVHVVYNYRLYGSAERALRVTLRPVMGSAASALVGWASLLLASMIGMQGIGWLATLGMFWVTVASIVVLPAVLALLDRAGWIAPDRVADRG